MQNMQQRSTETGQKLIETARPDFTARWTARRPRA